ncbi:hypothetical protein ACPESR_25030 [Nocardia testacea]|uniref:hypothetical protein n=1 Tax=Nocardia testacea TaxID=248551 RepID=UPI003C2D6110
MNRSSAALPTPGFAGHKARMQQLLDDGTRRAVTRTPDRPPELTFDEHWALTWGVHGRPPGKPLPAILRSGRPLTPDEQRAVALFDNALAKLPTVEGPVARHVHLTEEELARYVPGRSITEPAWISTSTNPAGVDPSITRGSNVEFHMVSRTGRDYGHYGTPDEVLFLRDTSFFVHNVIRLPDGKTVVQMAEV